MKKRFWSTRQEKCVLCRKVAPYLCWGRSNRETVTLSVYCGSTNCHVIVHGTQKQFEDPGNCVRWTGLQSNPCSRIRISQSIIHWCSVQNSISDPIKYPILTILFKCNISMNLGKMCIDD